MKFTRILVSIVVVQILIMGRYFKTQPTMNTIQQTGSTIEQGFLKFHEKHPLVYKMFKTYFDFLSNRKGWRRVSGKFIVEKIRAEVFTGSEHEDYKINNSYTALYVRMFLRENPEFASYFKLRKSQADGK